MRLPTALVVQNDADDPPARLGDWMVDAGLASHVVRPFSGDRLPADLDGYAALVVLGGGVSAHDDEAVRWLPDVKGLLRAAVAADMPTLAVCLGAQLLAVALGGRVDVGEPGPEIGPALVAKRDAAAADPLFGHVPFTPDVVQWHHDGITALPPGAVLLASSPKYPNQAFRVGRAAYGLQFHIETTSDIVRRWAEKNDAVLGEWGVDRERLLARLDEAHADVEDVWAPFTRRFVELAHRYDYDQNPDQNPGKGHAPGVEGTGDGVSAGSGDPSDEQHRT